MDIARDIMIVVLSQAMENEHLIVSTFHLYS